MELRLVRRSMSEQVYGTWMTSEEIDAFLYERGTGVISLSRESAAYGLPVSYGYDGDRQRCLLDLGFGPESKKRQFLKTTETACLTVYEWNAPTDWRSVLLTGHLDELAESLDTDVEELYYEHARDVEISVFDLPPEEVDLQWFEFDVEDRSGRTSR